MFQMKYGKMPGIEMPVSRVGIGADFGARWPDEAMIVFDDFLQRGGNFYDTAWIYGDGKADITLGKWVNSRGVRKQIVVGGKVAHIPYCNPKFTNEQIFQTLEWSGLEYLDICMLHRDDTTIPVGEFMDVLHEHQQAGRIKTIGASNWTIARIEEANEYARKKGKSGFTTVSNQFSIARMIEPPWPGCLSSSDPASRAWFIKTQMTMIPWSSQARGFFLPGRAHPDKKDDPMMVRAYYSEDNFQRLERVKELAEKKRVEPINIALAYSLGQPFPTFPLIGARQVSETESSLAALEIQLSPDEMKWVNLEV
jgi:aryl-alcohol dehydrogenase-like predicted oxidoreductase